MVPSILIVESSRTRQQHLAAAIGPIARIEAVADFAAARAQLRSNPPDVLVANLRLGEYNALHLVYTAACAGMPVRSIVYTERDEPGFATDVEAAGATYETFQGLLAHIAAYIAADFQPIGYFPSRPVLQARA